jgi:hypothetical protein
MIRPVVLLDELPWNQLNGDGELTLHCADPFLRTVEEKLRKTLYRWNHCRGDLLVEPFYMLERRVEIGDIGVDIKERITDFDKGNTIVSHAYIDQFSDMESIEKLHVPEITVDDETTQLRKAILEDIFGDILPIRIVGTQYATYYCPWDNIAMWRGVEPIYCDLYDNPELLHALMRKVVNIRKDVTNRLEALNVMESHSPYLHCTAGLVDDLPGEIEAGHVTRKNCWGRGMAQCFASVSPAMTDEFEIEYAKEYFDGFGLIYYGCCEPLDKKIEVVKKLPNLRKLSITPWADVHSCAEQMGKELVLSRKPNPAAVAVPALDRDLLRKDILETLEACRENGTSCEFVLKDISSVNYNPQNLTDWEAIVMETIRHF